MDNMRLRFESELSGEKYVSDEINEKRAEGMIERTDIHEATFSPH